MKNEFVYSYWQRTAQGKMMIRSGNFSYDDLVFLLPNNIKKMHGIPKTRIYGKKKSAYKRRRKHNILTYKLFWAIEDVVASKMQQKIEETINKFTYVNRVNIGSSTPEDEDELIDLSDLFKSSIVMPAEVEVQKDLTKNLRKIDSHLLSTKEKPNFSIREDYNFANEAKLKF